MKLSTVLGPSILLFTASVAFISAAASTDEACPLGSQYVSAKASEERSIYDADTVSKIGLRNIGQQAVFVQLNREVPLQNDLQPRQLGMYETDYLLVRGEKSGLAGGKWELCVTIAE